MEFGMRSTGLGLVAIIAAAFAAGFFAFSFRRPPLPPAPNLAATTRLRAEFLGSRSPLTTLDPASLFAPEHRAELLDPDRHRPATLAHAYAALSTLFKYSRDCDPRYRRGWESARALAKAWQWHAFRCGHSPSLPEDFFESAPLLHPSGSSFVYLAWQSGAEPYRSSEWLRTHARLAHALEYAQFPLAALEPAQAELRELDASALRALFQGAVAVVTSTRVWLRPEAGEVSTNDYRIFRREDFHASLRPTDLRFEPLAMGESCLLTEGNGCWSMDVAKVIRQGNRLPRYIWTSLALFIALTGSVALLKGAHAQRREQARRRFALQTLTHELRTPVTSLVLSAETLRARYDALSPELQEVALTVMNESQRLLRVTERSQQYLKVGEGDLLEVHPVLIASLHEFLSEQLADIPGAPANVEGAHFSVEHDPYWLSTCFRNLVENAIKHGKAPVHVRVAEHGAQFTITLSDAGDFNRNSAAPSAGLGLGLELVARICDALGGRLHTLTAPTRVTLELPKETDGVSA